MRLTKILIILTLVCQLTGVHAEKSGVNEIVRSIVKNDTTELFLLMYRLKKKDKTLAQSDENTTSLVIALLLQKLNIESNLRNKSINLNASAIIDSCKLRIGLQTNETYELFCTTAFTPARSFIEQTLTPLQATCLTGDLAAMKMLIKAGANIDGDPEVLSPLTSCLATKKFKQVDFLLDQGADVKVENFSLTLLSTISEVSGSESDQAEAERLAEKLIANGADPHYLDEKKYGELEAAIVFKNLAVVKVLVKHGVDINAKTTKGLTPLSLAEKNNNAAIVEFLKLKGAER